MDTFERAMHHSDDLYHQEQEAITNAKSAADEAVAEFSHLSHEAQRMCEDFT